MVRFILFSFLVLLAPLSAQAEAQLKTSAKQAVVVDYDTGAVLFEKNADERMPTSSMSKVITMYEIFKAVDNGDLSLDQELLVSEKAWRKQGSKMFVEVGKTVKVEDLIRGVIIQSGNDATIVLAEGLAGSENAFADLLNQTAHDLGMEDSHFANASGWPDPDHYSTARDLSTLGVAIIRNFPNHYKYYSEQEFTYNNIKQQNRNPLLYRSMGADGIKTGHTEAGGYGLIGSGTRNNRRVVIVINGLKDEAARAQESAKILEWGLGQFQNYTLFKAGEAVETAAVAIGKEKSVPATLEEDLTVTVPRLYRDNVKITAQFKEPVPAPVTAGQEIGTLVVDIPGQEPVERPLYAASNVEKLGFISSAIEKAKLTLTGVKPTLGE